MKRLARLATVAVLAALAVPRAASATPFSDVPANHWAYQYIQSLAADGIVDGYPDGRFKGDRPMTRYEMAVVVARAIAKLQENQTRGASKEDLDKLQKLIDALKDELDSLGVRVTNLEDSLDALDRRTKFAQSLSLHGAFLPNVTARQRFVIPRTVQNTTGAPVTTYYGVTVPYGTQPTAANPNPPNQSSVGTIDPFVNAFLTTDDTNNPLTQAGSGIQIRQDTRFSLAYAIDDDLTVSLPVHIINFEYGGDFTQNAKFDIEPGVDIAIAHAGALSNLDFKFGLIDNMTSSRLGLAFRAPQGYNGAVPYDLPYQPFQKGVLVKGTVGEGAFGITDVEASFTRVDNTLINTATAIDPSLASFNLTNYFNPIVPAQATYTQTTAAAVPRTDQFSSGSGTLGQVFLTQKAVAGSVYISNYNGEIFDATGTPIGGPRLLPSAPAFTYSDSTNSVVFGFQIPANVTLGISYRGLGTSQNSAQQRYMIHFRANQKFKGYEGLEVGLTFNRVFDFDDLTTSGLGQNGITQAFASPLSGYGDVSDTVLGLDFQATLPFEVAGAGSKPVVFGELADSKYTADFRNTPAVGDTAAVLGARVTVHKIELSAIYQSVGQDYFSGAPFHYYGNAPATFANYRGGYVPDFFGFANTLGINQQFDQQFVNAGVASPNTAGNPNLTFVYPMFNPLRASGPEFYSAYAPNSRGETFSVNAPVRVGDFNFVTKGSYQHLEEIVPGSFGTAYFGPTFATNVRERDDTYTVGTTFKLPVFGGQQLTSNLSASYEALKRLDATKRPYYPVNPSTQQYDTSDPAFAAGGALAGGSAVSYYPNYVDVRKIGIAAAAALPLTRDLTLSGTYSTQRYGGSYGTTETQNISERKDYYSGGLTYAIPKTNSSLSFLARRYTYVDDSISNTNFSQNRQDVNFTVRF